MAIYPIREAARLSGLPATTIRYYETIGLLDPAERDASSGHRVYSEEDLVLLEAVACLHATGLSVPDMRTYLDNRNSGADGAKTQIALLEAQAERLALEADYLELRRTYVALKTKFWQAILDGRDDEADCFGNEASAIATKLAEAARSMR